MIFAYLALFWIGSAKSTLKLWTDQSIVDFMSLIGPRRCWIFYLHFKNLKFNQVDQGNQE